MSNIQKFNRPDIGLMDHDEALQHLIKKLSNNRELNFFEQCAMFLIVLAQHKGVMSRDEVLSIKGNLVLWGKIQPMVSSLSKSFPTQTDIINAECFDRLVDFELENATPRQDCDQKNNDDQIIKFPNFTKRDFGAEQLNNTCNSEKGSKLPEGEL